MSIKRVLLGSLSIGDICNISFGINGVCHHTDPNAISYIAEVVQMVGLAGVLTNRLVGWKPGMNVPAYAYYAHITAPTLYNRGYDRVWSCSELTTVEHLLPTRGSNLLNVVDYIGYPKVNKPIGSCVCKRCNQSNEYAEPNRDDGSYVCFNCR